MWRAPAEDHKQHKFDPDKYFPKLSETIQKLFHEAHGYNAYNYDRFGSNSSYKVVTVDHIGNTALLRRFESARVANPHLKVTLGFHGTASSNHESIKERGLIIPSTQLQVVNGSAYGRGIYVSKCPQYSASYVRREPKMFVCAVLTGDKGRVKEEGKIMVAFDEKLVVPFAVLTYQGPAPSHYDPGLAWINHPVASYVLWWVQMFGFFLIGSLVTLAVTTLIMTISYLIGFGYVPLQGYSSYLMTGGTSKIMSVISYAQVFNWTVWRALVYCVFWKVARLVIWKAFLPALGLVWAGTSLAFKSLYYILPSPISYWNEMGIIWKLFGVTVVTCVGAAIYARHIRRYKGKYPLNTSYSPYVPSKKLI